MLHELLLLRRVRQLALQQQIADLEEIALHGQLLDRVTAVEKLALVAVDVGDRRRARGGRDESRVVGELAGLAVQRADVDHLRADRAGQHRKAYRRGAVAEVQCRVAVGHGIWLQAAVTGGPHGISRRVLKWISGIRPAAAAQTSAGSMRPDSNVPQVVVAIVQQQVERGDIGRGSARRRGHREIVRGSDRSPACRAGSASAGGRASAIGFGLHRRLAGCQRWLARRRKRGPGIHA